MKIDNDDSPSKDKKVTLSISGGQNNDKAKLIIKDDTDGEGFVAVNRLTQRILHGVDRNINNYTY